MCFLPNLRFLSRAQKYFFEQRIGRSVDRLALNVKMQSITLVTYMHSAQMKISTF